MAKDPYKPQIKTHLEDFLPSVWLEGHGNIKIDLKNNPELKGATNAIFYEVEAKVKFVMKFGLRDVPKEKSGYKILKNSSTRLKDHLVPLIGEDKNIDDLGFNKAILLTPYINSSTLHEIVSQKIAHKEWIFRLYSDFLNELKNLWKETCKPDKPCLEEIYLKRLTSRFLEFKKEIKLKEKSKTRLIINSKEIKIEEEIIPFIQEKIAKLRNKVKHSCTIHGDEHAKNILVRKSSIGIDEKAWVLIDCGNALEQGDWIFSIAKILHWWKVYFAIENMKGKNNIDGQFKKISNDKIEIQYDEVAFRKNIPKICEELTDKTLSFCKEVNKEIFQEKDSAWRQRLNIALFIMLFGSAALHLDPKKKFAVPFLIGESFRYLREL